MKKYLVRSLVVSLTIVLTVGAAQACSRKPVSGGAQLIDASRKINQRLLDRAILSEVNYERCRAGLSPVRSEPRLIKAAAGHSAWMAKARRVSHKSTVSGRQTVRARIKRTGIKIRTGAENIGMVHRFKVDNVNFLIRNASSCQFATHGGQPIPQHSYASLARTIVKFWMNSHGHRANILNRQVRMMGTAAALDKSAEYCGTYYITQDFAG